MSIKTSQAILKCLIDLKSRVWFTLGSEDETVFCDTSNFFQLDCRLSNLNFALMYRNNIEFYSFFAIEWTAKFTENMGLPAI